jgi:predicted RNase H-like HicB family nuclease
MLKIETGKECDGRWIAEVPSLPGVAYGETKANARLNVIVLVLRVIADRLEHREPLTVQ